MIKVLTTLSQSQRLLDAGIDRHTADLTIPTGTTPVWSVVALIELMPTTLKIGDDEYNLVIHKWHDPEKDEVVYDIGYDDYHNFSLKAFECYKHLLDAVVDMMEWLLSTGNIKELKGGNDE